jgi:hypothetical protein
MNTEKSEQFVQAWKRDGNPLRRVRFAMERTFQTSASVLFGLLCPTTELDWLGNWRCELLHSDSGYAELNAVFRTHFFGPEEIWVCTLYEPGRAIAYARVSEDVTGTLAVSLVENGDGSVTGMWNITVSALNERGNAAVADGVPMEEAFAGILDELEHYVNTGQMVS